MNEAAATSWVSTIYVVYVVSLPVLLAWNIASISLKMLTSVGEDEKWVAVEEVSLTESLD